MDRTGPCNYSQWLTDANYWSVQSWSELCSHINDLPARGPRWGLLFSPLCGWEKTTESKQISADRQQQHIGCCTWTDYAVIMKIFARQCRQLLKNWFPPSALTLKLLSGIDRSICENVYERAGLFSWLPWLNQPITDHATAAAWTATSLNYIW